MRTIQIRTMQEIIDEAKARAVDAGGDVIGTLAAEVAILEIAHARLLIRVTQAPHAVQAKPVAHVQVTGAERTAL